MLLNTIANLVYKHRPWRRQDIIVNGALYLQRTCLFSWGKAFIYLHEFVTGDGSEAFHSHPFYMFSTVLRGAYWEQFLDGSDRKVVWWNLIKPDTAHRIAYVLPGTWTLCFGWRARKTWAMRDKFGKMKVIFSDGSKWDKPK